MIHIIPAAGSDFVDAEGGVKFDRKVGDASLLELTVLNRSWCSPEDEYIFVFQKSTHTELFSKKLTKILPQAKFVFLTNNTNGAASTVLAGLSLVDKTDTICVDLSDIIVAETITRATVNETMQSSDALALTFQSDSKQYSYLEFSDDSFVRSREKCVISDNASAGIYFFKNRNTLLTALSQTLDYFNYMHAGLNFVCPALNGLEKVKKIPLTYIIDIKDTKVNTTSNGG